MACLEYARANGCEWNEGACEAAAANGRLEALRWLRERGAPWEPATIARVARKGGHEEVLRWAAENGCPDLTADA